MQPQTSRRWPPAAPNNPAKLSFLQHTMSMANLHDEPAWTWPRSPPSPSASTTSTVSRSATPTTANPTNPWANAVNSSTTPPKSNSQSSSPLSTSRCPTPVAPQPVRPAVFPSGLGANANVSPTTDKSSKGNDFPPTPAPNPWRERESADLAALTSVSNAIITPSLVRQYSLLFPNFLSRQGWERQTKQRSYSWAAVNPRTALLFLIYGDIGAWRKAVIFGLEDGMLPYKESDLDGIVENPRRACEMQWRVLAKELPQSGQHTEFQPREYVPLQQVSVISQSSNLKSVDRVRWCGDVDDRVYVRKRVAFRRPEEKHALLAQLEGFRNLEHPNVARIICSYAHEPVVGFISASCKYSLEDYLRLPPDPSRSKFLLDWIHDLTQALQYIHSMDVVHKSIRPQKLLVDGPRVLFSAFGISNEAASSPPRGEDPLRTNEPSYVWAAPESISRGRINRASDVFSLGCVFLTMVSVIKGKPTSIFHAYLAGGTADGSFHANAERVSMWRKHLATITNAAPQRRERTMAVENRVLEFITAMISQEPAKRVRIRKLAPHVSDWNTARAELRRKSFDGGVAPGRWNEAETHERAGIGRSKPIAVPPMVVPPPPAPTPPIKTFAAVNLTTMQLRRPFEHPVSLSSVLLDSPSESPSSSPPESKAQPPPVPQPPPALQPPSIEAPKPRVFAELKSFVELPTPFPEQRKP